MAQSQRATIPKLPNGMLNPQPRGQWITITQFNSQQSPLLRLPAEVRIQIWEYALGGLWIRLGLRLSHGTMKAYIFAIREEFSKHYRPTKKRYFDLLQVCRQIYSETALLPWSLNPVSPPPDIGSQRTGILPAQVNAITTLQIWDSHITDENIHHFALIPSLKTIYVLAYTDIARLDAGIALQISKKVIGSSDGEPERLRVIRAFVGGQWSRPVLITEKEVKDMMHKWSEENVKQRIKASASNHVEVTYIRRLCPYAPN
ncbi:hypothetical protein BDV96DRAFT_597183 [Lophiotrema nucula]|uniref:DUF7730 domain-containing protein n=1 Tax=Lophiotrema nucula TaxID=690887 RepID=A0A6A5ZFT6_9PLEO|nr:hypothetical protein BDV96DRAFT_597183 [Lophiotrema nucula]